MFIKTPEWMKTSHIFRKNYINPSMMSKAIKKYSHIETEPRTKKKMYRAGKSTSLDSNFFNGSTLNNKEVELKVKTFFPEQGVVDKMVELAEKITDFVMPSDGTLLDNTSDYPIAINMDCYIKNPMKETKIEFLGLDNDKVKVPVVPVNIKHQENKFIKRKLEENIYPHSSKILKVENIQEPIQAEWRKPGEEKGSKFLIIKDNHLVFDGDSVVEGILSGRKSTWKLLNE